MSEKPKLELPVAYEVGYGKPPAATRFKPGVSGNPNGRPRGSKNKLPGMAEERLKTIMLQEAYRNVPIMDRGRTRSVTMIEANVRAMAINGAKGNNRAANIFTSNVMKIEAERNKTAHDHFAAAIDYKQRWGAELERRKRLGLNLPDPVPHPDDLVLDRQNMKVHIRGPMTREDQELWQFGEMFLEILQEKTQELQQLLEREEDQTRRNRLQSELKANEGHIKQLLRLFGPPEIRRQPHTIRELEDEFGMELTECHGNTNTENDRPD